jgi:hypothetical protein
MTQVLGQAIFNPPSVFGWKEGLDWLTSNHLLQRNIIAEQLADARPEDAPPYAWEPAALLGSQQKWKKLDPPKVVARLLDRLGRVRAEPSTIAVLETYLQTGDDGQPAPFELDEATADKKVRGLVALILSSPEYQLA